MLGDSGSTAEVVDETIRKRRPSREGRVAVAVTPSIMRDASDALTRDG
jgi:hypothetical protein